MTITITGLYYYPLKSARGIAVNSIDLLSRGLEYDRRWMLVDPVGQFLTQREHPRMALLETAIVEQGIQLSAAGYGEITAQVEQNKNITVTVWGDIVNAKGCCQQVDHWCSDFIEAPCRLVYMPDSSNRAIDPDYRLSSRDEVSFADGFPVLVTSEASLNQLNAELEIPVPMSRFRPNIVVSGCGAFAEDDWNSIQTEYTELQIVKPCRRCQITTIDQKTSLQPNGTEPLKTLKRIHSWDKNIFFGQNAIPTRTGEISLGEQCRVS